VSKRIMITLSDKLYNQLSEISDDDLSKSTIIAIALKEYIRTIMREREKKEKNEREDGIYII